MHHQHRSSMPYFSYSKTLVRHPVGCIIYGIIYPVHGIQYTVYFDVHLEYDRNMTKLIALYIDYTVIVLYRFCYCKCFNMIRWSAIAFLGTLLIDMVLSNATNSVACYNAARCRHSYKQKCGINTRGWFHRFRDKCSMSKYNCEHKDNYIRTSLNMCRRLPRFTKKFTQIT